MQPMARSHPAPFALASDGTLLVNVALLDKKEQARAGAARVFVGVPLPASARRSVLARLENAAAEAAALIEGKKRRRKPR